MKSELITPPPVPQPEPVVQLTLTLQEAKALLDLTGGLDRSDREEAFQASARRTTEAEVVDISTALFAALTEAVQKARLRGIR